MRRSVTALFRRYLPRVGISVLNQVVASGANFALNVYLVRTLPMDQYGWYGIGVAAAILYVGFGNGLFLTQMVVHLPAQPSERRGEFSANMLGLVALLVACTWLLAGALAIGIDWVGAEPNYGAMGVAIALAATAALCSAFFVRLAYAAMREGRALASHIATAVALASVLAIEADGTRPRTAAEALWIYAAVHGVGALAGLAAARVPLRSVGLSGMRAAFHVSVSGGKWAMGGVAVTWLQSQSYVYVAALLLDVSRVAALNASRMVVAPLTFLLPAFTQLALPRMARLRPAGPAEVARVGRRYERAFVAGWAAYLVGLVSLGVWVIPYLVGEAYDRREMLWLAVGWTGVMFFQLRRTSASLVLQAMHAFRSLTVANARSAVITIALAVPLTAVAQEQGTLTSLAIGEALLAWWLWRQAPAAPSA